MIIFLLILILILLVMIYRALQVSCKNQVVHAKQFGFILQELRKDNRGD